MPINFFIPLIIILALYFAGAVALVQIKEDTSIANSSWTGGCLIVALYTLMRTDLYLARQLIVTLMIAIWALRLMTYVYLRYRGNDPRFLSWKQKGFKALAFNLIYIFGGQLFLTAVMSVPAIIINTSIVPGLNPLDFLGIGIWLIGYFFESVSDYELYVFMKNPTNKGHLLRTGLWRYSRHPNYFGEVTMWWGIFLMTLSVPHGVYAIIAPATITTMLLFVTGVPWVEAALAKNPEFADYKRKTSIFIPWWPKA